MKLRYLTLTAAAAILSACATTTPYQPASKPGSFDGFTQTLIENDRARVSFAGNSSTERETVENYLIFRAAELAIERGYDHFSFEERDTETKTRLSSTGSSFNRGFGSPFGYSFYSPRFGWSRFGSFRGSRFSRFNSFGRFNNFGRFNSFGGFNNFSVREITKYRATAEVKFRRGIGSSADEGKTFNAREVIENLGPTIVYPEAEGGNQIVQGVPAYQGKPVQSLPTNTPTPRPVANEI